MHEAVCSTPEQCVAVWQQGAHSRWGGAGRACCGHEDRLGAGTRIGCVCTYCIAFPHAPVRMRQRARPGGRQQSCKTVFLFACHITSRHVVLALTPQVKWWCRWWRWWPSNYLFCHSQVRHVHACGAAVRGTCEGPWPRLRPFLAHRWREQLILRGMARAQPLASEPTPWHSLATQAHACYWWGVSVVKRTSTAPALAAAHGQVAGCSKRACAPCWCRGRLPVSLAAAPGAHLCLQCYRFLRLLLSFALAHLALTRLDLALRDRLGRSCWRPDVSRSACSWSRALHPHLDPNAVHLLARSVQPLARQQPGRC